MTFECAAAWAVTTQRRLHAAAAIAALAVASAGAATAQGVAPAPALITQPSGVAASADASRLSATPVSAAPQASPAPAPAVDPHADEFSGAPTAYAPSEADLARDALARALKRRVRGMNRARRAELRAAYDAAEGAFFWTRVSHDGVDFARGRAALAAASVLEAHALPPRRSEIAALAARMDASERAATEAAAADAKDARAEKKRRRELAALEIQLSVFFANMADSMASGLFAPRALSKNMDVTRPRRAVDDLLSGARAAPDLAAYLETLGPQTAEYAALKARYARERAAAVEGAAGPELARGPSLRFDDAGPRVAALRSRLVALGALDEAEPVTRDAITGEVYFDEAMDVAVRAAQERLGLKVDGVVGRRTLAALNRGPEQRALQLAVNMERRRWRNFAVEPRRIEVNIPNFEVELYDADRVVYASRVVVGKRRHQTPEFDDEMSHVVINPTWNVPKSIATKELLPVIQNDPSVLFQRNMEVLAPGIGSVSAWDVDWWSLSPEYFPYRLRQRPGRGNALGDVKFIFPNKHAVYLHDTPHKSLFKEDVRAFSHGCVRVATPVEFAEQLLSAQHDDPLAFYRSQRSKPGERFVKLKKKVPVHIVYRTAWLDDAGEIQFRPDIYRRDKLVGGALTRAGLSFKPGADG